MVHQAKMGFMTSLMHLKNRGWNRLSRLAHVEHCYRPGRLCNHYFLLKPAFHTDSVISKKQ